MRYTHTSPNDEVKCRSGSFYVEAEETLDYAGKKVLYLLESTTQLTTCCGGSCGMSFISVPGFVKKWQNKMDVSGMPVSEVDQVMDEGAKEEIKRLLTAKHGIANIDFW